MKKVLVSGGSGFIGKVLVKKLLANGRKVLVVDNLSSSSTDGLPEESENFFFIKGDIGQFLNDIKGNKEFIFDEIYHLASPVGPVGVLNYKGKIAYTIINHLYAAAQAAIEMGAKLCEISTSEVYGKNPIFDQPEDIDKIVPSNYTVRLEYGVAKLAGEVMLSNMAKANPDFKYIVIRPFNIIGPQQNKDLGFVVPRFITQALANEPMTVYGDGTSKRTFTDVRDISEAIILLMSADFNNRAFNIGNPNNIITIGELARKIKYLTNSSSEIVFVDPKELHGKDFEEAWNKIPNIDRIKSLIGWEPQISLNSSLVDAIKEAKGE